MTAICPTDVIEAPIDVVWRLLTDPAGWGDFFDVRVRQVDPPGPAKVGQRVRGESGPRFLRLAVRFEFTHIDPAGHRLGVDVHLPLGVTVREDLDCKSIDANRCRVNYRCDFGFPAGWRGWMAHALLRHETRLGPIESLARLKAAAERVHSGSKSGAS